MFPFCCIQDLYFDRNITEVMLCAMFFSVNHIQRPLAGDISCSVSPDDMLAYILWEITIALNIILLRFTHTDTCHFSLSFSHTHIFLSSFSLSFIFQPHSYSKSVWKYTTLSGSMYLLLFNYYRLNLQRSVYNMPKIRAVMKTGGLAKQQMPKRSKGALPTGQHLLTE